MGRLRSSGGRACMRMRAALEKNDFSLRRSRRPCATGGKTPAGRLDRRQRRGWSRPGLVEFEPPTHARSRHQTLSYVSLSPVTQNSLVPAIRADQGGNSASACRRFSVRLNRRWNSPETRAAKRVCAASSATLSGVPQIGLLRARRCSISSALDAK